MEKFVITDDTALAELKRRLLARSAPGGSPAAAARLESVRTIVEAVRTEGDAAVARFTEQFDGVRLAPERFELTREEIEAAESRVDPETLAALGRAMENIRDFHCRNLRQSWEQEYSDGSVIGQRVGPVESAGVYVPGGKAFYPSSVLMNIVPARVAGVPEIIMVSPPSCDGDIHPGVVAAARMAGATRVFRVGGAQAVAALAFGTETIPAVCKITGPGNAYVTAAKALVRGAVEIDSEAGPSEVLVLADASTNPRYAATELFAQAEHDEEAMCLLVADSEQTAAAVAAVVDAELPALRRAGIASRALDELGMLIVARSAAEAVDLANFIAPEHLSVQTRDPEETARGICNAGAVMVGPMTPVAVGDYIAGPNHVLPTMRRARFSSPLTAEDFRKVTSYIKYSEERLRAQGADLVRLAELEGLEAHARSVTARLEES
ncbi:MAG TPA: histidinol dehydrogenase [Candidatus Hydrogenedentes bacterium]|nr:histidinol dehydrogenase [Candidatus Hydrogenedentota bacterium]